MLSSKQRAKLASLAQTAASLASLGRAGLTDAFVSRMDVLLRAHELVKMRFQDFKDSKRELSAELARRTNSELVSMVGNVAVFFRRNEDPERRKIELGEE